LLLLRGSPNTDLGPGPDPRTPKPRGWGSRPFPFTTSLSEALASLPRVVRIHRAAPPP